jgi:15-cis-phytoene synthase
MAGGRYAEWMAERQDLGRCAELLRAGSKTFTLASRALPRRYRQPATALYAFCRVADDAIDHGSDPAAALVVLRERLEAIYAGRPLDDAADRAFARVARTYAIPMALPLALLEGFEWDAEGRRYETLGELTAYAARVAGAVGVCMALIMEVASPAALARACDLGIAMQMTNIARDVGEDAAAGRLYLPREWLKAEGIDADEWLGTPCFDARLARVVARLLAEAELYYERAGRGIPALPAGCRPAINAARLLYAEIGREVERQGLDSVTRRAVVSRARKLGRLAAAFRLDSMGTPEPAAVTAAEAQFLVDAAVAARREQDTLPRTPVTEPGLDARVEWLVDLFERLERNERAAG